MALAMTDFAFEKAKALRAAEGHPEGWVLYFSLIAGGCSGFMYDLKFIEPPEDESLFNTIEGGAIRLFCEVRSHDMLGDIEIDYQESLLSSGFSCNSPKVSSSCGCGESVKF